MSIVLIDPNRDFDSWVKALQQCDASVKVEVWPRVERPDEVEYALCWNQPAGVLAQFRNLRCISSLGAGVDHLLEDTTLPAGVPLVRVVDDALKQSMAEYIMLGILAHLRGLGDYLRQQRQGLWSAAATPLHAEVQVGIMGYGELGRHVGDRLSAFGFGVHGWRRRSGGKHPQAIYAGERELGAFLARSTILVCLLPLTAATEDILDARLFAQLPPGAYLINVARGKHLVEQDLLEALEAGQLSGALLDVFREEPLPATHPFWAHERITLTPHIASITSPVSAAPQVIDNYHRARSGRPLLHLVDPVKGY